MKIFLFISIFLVLITGCNNSSQNEPSTEPKLFNDNVVSSSSDTLTQNNNLQTDSLTTDTLTNLTKTTKKEKIKSEKNFNPPVRMIDFPSDANFNGSPMTQQEDIPKAILEKQPDTLSKLAIARYKTYSNFFPKSISDNFEEGKSTEHIHYPNVLIFRFELFENENSFKPYHIEEVKVRRNPNGEIYTEK